MKAINPTTSQTLADYPTHDHAEVERRLSRGQQTFKSWSALPFAERSARLRAASAALREGRASHARLMTEEMGKPIVQAEAEVDKCAWVCEYFAEHAERLLAPERVATEARTSYVS